MAFNNKQVEPLPPGIEAMVKKCIEPPIKINYSRSADEYRRRFLATREQEQRLIIAAVGEANARGDRHFVDACCENLVEAMNGEDVNMKPEPSVFDRTFAIILAGMNKRQGWP